MFGAEDVSSGAAEERPAAVVRLLDQRLGAEARPVRSSDVGVRLPEVGRHGVDDGVRDLRAAGPVEEREVVRSDEKRARTASTS